MFRAIVAVSFALCLSGCGEPTTTDPQEQWTIASYLSPCGYQEQTGCLLRQEGIYSQSIFGGIIGLDWRWGTTYRVTIETTEIDPYDDEEWEVSILAQPPLDQHHLIAIHSEHEDEIGTRYEYSHIVLSYGTFYRYAAASYFLGYQYQCALETQDECDFIHELEQTGVEEHLELVFQYQGDGAIALVEATFIDKPSWW